MVCLCFDPVKYISSSSSSTLSPRHICKVNNLQTLISEIRELEFGEEGQGCYVSCLYKILVTVPSTQHFLLYLGHSEQSKYKLIEILVHMTATLILQYMTDARKTLLVALEAKYIAGLWHVSLEQRAEEDCC